MEEPVLTTVEVANQVDLSTIEELLQKANSLGVDVFTTNGSFHLEKTISYGDMLISVLLITLIVLTIFKIVSDSIRR